MDSDKDQVKAWLVCEDIFNKLKTELITQSMDSVKEAIDSKFIDVKGSLISLPDKASDTEMYMFIINKLLDEKENMMNTYSKYIGDVAPKDATPQQIEQSERLNKFLLVEKIDLLMGYSKVFDDWMHDVGMQVTNEDPSDIIKTTIKGDDQRLEVIQFALRNSTILREKVLDDKERKILEDAIKGL